MWKCQRHFTGTCGRQEFTLGTNRECPYSIGLTLIIMRWWSSFALTAAVSCVGQSSNRTYGYSKENKRFLLTCFKELYASILSTRMSYPTWKCLFREDNWVIAWHFHVVQHSKEGETWVKDHSFHFWGCQNQKIPFLAVLLSFFALKPHGNACYSD